MIPDKLAEETLQDYVQRGCTLKLVCKQFARATTQHFRQHFHAFGPPHPVTAVDYPWHPLSFNPEISKFYWEPLYGAKGWNRYPDVCKTERSLSITRLPTVRFLSLDLRRKNGHYELRRNGVRRSYRPAISSILARLVLSARNLEELNLRISPDQESIHSVEHLLSITPTLRRIVIEVDQSGPLYPREVRFRLQNTVHEGIAYQALDRFVLRCPGISIECRDSRGSKSDFIYRLRNVKHFSISTRRLISGMSDRHWLWSVLQRTPLLEACQFAVDVHPTNYISPSPECANAVSLRYLTDLVLEAPGVHTGLLRQLDAPRLTNLRVGSDVIVDEWPSCRFNQFPALSMVNIRCPGPSALRLTRLGIPFCKFWRNLDDENNYEIWNLWPFSAVIHAPSWAPLKTVVDDQDIKTFNLPLPKMVKGEQRSFDIPVGRYAFPDGEPVQHGPPSKKRRLCLFSTNLLT
ncbi:hypothetical protein OC844_006331 [Tilletia horrida]|nr:hypothetical protein OC844_006331 [Tilletia horrida]